MKNSGSPLKRMFWPLLVVLVLLSACGGQTSQPAKPVASITAPASGSSFALGQEVRIAYSAADVKGVAQVELSIDGQPQQVEVVSPPVNSFAASYSWYPQVVGSHAIELQAFNVDGQASELVQIVVAVQDTGVAVATATPSPTTPLPTPTPTFIVFTPTPVVPLTATPVPAEEKPRVTTLVGLNVRTGPSLDHDIIGLLAKGESAEITGRDQFGGWWQIIFRSEQGDRGWVAAGSEFSTASNTGNVPVVDAPPPGSPPTATPSQLKPTIHSFTADRYDIAAGAQVTLRWDLSNAEAAFLRYDDREEGVVAPGSKVVSPSRDTVYTLVARNQAGETTAQVTITVGGPTPTPVPVWEDGQVRIVNGQSIDFDQGVVQDSTGANTDFFWDGAQQRFTPQNGASGALLSDPYDQIGLAGCLEATYGLPIGGVGGSGLITGCYKTSEGRYGKFYVSDWDTAANLTINWLTWDYR